MKKYLNIIAIAVIALFTYSCEETVNGVDLPYQELLVIRGEMIADSTFSIHITKTLPPLEEYDLAKAHIDGVKATIECDNITYPLTNDGWEFYFNSDLIPRAGKTYKLTVEWKNHKAYATTTIPINNDTIYNFTVKNETRTDKWGWKITDYTFIGTAEIDGNSATSIYANYDIPYYSIGFQYFNRFVNNYNGVLNLGTATIYNDNIEAYQLNSLYINKFDIQYYDYYITMNEGEMDSDVFVVSGNNINWNVKGDGIGLFIGSNKKEIWLK